MRRRARGFSLVELLLALAMGLVLVLGGSQVVIDSRATHASQQAAMSLQDDARFVLGKIIQDIRQAGMFGCLATGFIENAPPAFDRPVSWSGGAGGLVQARHGFEVVVEHVRRLGCGDFQRNVHRGHRGGLHRSVEPVQHRWPVLLGVVF